MNERIAAILILSDRAAQGIYQDRSGPVAQEKLQEAGYKVVSYQIIADEIASIQTALTSLVDDHAPHLIITSGGTGVSLRDVTPEAIRPLLDQEVPGIGELLRASGAQFTPLSYASRSIGGFIKHSLVVALPGNPKAVVEGFDALQEHLLPHLINIRHGSNKGSSEK